MDEDVGAWEVARVVLDDLGDVVRDTVSRSHGKVRDGSKGGDEAGKDVEKTLRLLHPLSILFFHNNRSLSRLTAGTRYAMAYMAKDETTMMTKTTLLVS